MPQIMQRWMRGSLRDAFRKKKKFQTIVKKVGGGDPQTQNKNLKLILDKSIGREGGKSVCQNFKNDQNMIKVLFCLGIEYK